MVDVQQGGHDVAFVGFRVGQSVHSPTSDVRCDLAVADSVRAFAAALTDRTKYLDVLVNNGAAYVEGDDVGNVSDGKIESLMAAGGTSTALLTKHLLPLLLRASS